jgi:hypothetical protein
MGMMLAVAYHDNIPNVPTNFQTCGTINYGIKNNKKKNILFDY